MKDNKYNVILMRSDTSVRSFRLNPFWMKFFFFMILVLFSAAGAGIYFAHVFFEEKEELARQYQIQAQSLNEAQRELSRLRNLERIYESFRDEELRALVASQRRENREVPAPEVDLGSILETVDQNIVSISNVQSRFIQGRMRVQLEVNNMVGSENVSGRVYFSLIRNDGTIIDLDVEDRDLYYAIARFKRVETTFELPQEVEPDSIFALRVKARDDEGRLVYSQIYPMADILI